MMTQNNEKPVFFFDIDNCLYPKSTNIQHMMSDLIGRSSLLPLVNLDLSNICTFSRLIGSDKYFETHLSLSQKDANALHFKYYKEYGLAIEGLVRHHKVDALDYNTKVDDALPLEDVIKPNPALRELLEDIDRSKVRLWLFTNAYINHGKRVVTLLGIDDLFEGITYCDYGSEKFYCKPHADMYDKAMCEAGVALNRNCYFVDDSYINTKAAYERGWNTAHLLDPSDPEPSHPSCKYVIRSLKELRSIFPQFFQTATNGVQD
ncbi:pyrimidine 5-nucleotidase [Lojkania enalia]|uniref:Pyrimidine 5-nucleotidase n=1 Tax=Lojkania enalia TaxID=147567 RepID=A0A9P4K3Y9_9PLEO|nr:pyrimidine 5-nucleotidase [Didymosphaeria enalia]